MASRNRFVFFGLLGLVGVSGLVLAHGMQWAWDLLGWQNPALFGMRQLQVTALAGWGLALCAGLVVMQAAPTRQFANDVADEMLRISWPSRDETRHATVVVIACVLLCAAFLGLFDSLWLATSSWLLSGQTGP